jgi:uncharacterized protein (DUF2141 family)
VSESQGDTSVRLFAFACFAFAVLDAQNAPAGGHDAGEASVIIVRVVGLPNSTGTVRAALWTGGDGFPEDTEHAAMLAEVPISHKEATVSFEGVRCVAGCAVSLYHDENRNQVLDRNSLGMPKEAVGVSRDALGRFGPRGFEESSFRSSSPRIELLITVRSY